MFRLFCLIVLAAASVYDVRHLEIPDCACALLLGTAVIWTPSGELCGNIPSAAVIWLAYLALHLACGLAGSPVPIGMGDIKLLSVLSLQLGALESFKLFAAAGMLSGFAAAYLLLFRRAGPKTEMAFAPFISAAYALILLEGALGQPP